MPSKTTTRTLSGNAPLTRFTPGEYVLGLDGTGQNVVLCRKHSLFQIEQVGKEEWLEIESHLRASPGEVLRVEIKGPELSEEEMERRLADVDWWRKEGLA